MFGINKFNQGGQSLSPAFKPRELFKHSETGFWYDPSDIGTTFGPELVTNGTFDTDTDWTKSTGWTISGGKLVGTAVPGAGNIAGQGATVEDGKSYWVSYTISDYSAGGFRILIYGPDDVGVGATRSSNGYFEELITIDTATTTATNEIRVQAISGHPATASIDNISVREVISINTKLFQDSAGTTPVTGVEQPVGLMLDKSQGATLGAELASATSIVDPDWTDNGDGSYDYVGDGTLDQLRFSTASTVGKAYRITFTVDALSGGSLDATWSGTTFAPIDAIGNYEFTSIATATEFGFKRQGTDVTSATVSNISVKEVAGQHATQATSASRPTLSARYNLLEQTEAFDDAYWSKTNTTVTANATTDPLGGSTADLLTENTGTGVHRVVVAYTYLAKDYTGSFYVKDNGAGWCYIGLWDGITTRYANFNLSAGTVGTTFGVNSSSITDVGNGWYKVSADITSAAGTGDFNIRIGDADNVTSYTGDGTSGIYIWGASLVESQYAHLPYQRVGDASTTASDYDSSNSFPKYLKFDGTDDYMVVNGLSAASGPITAHFGYVTDDGESGNSYLLGIDNTEPLLAASQITPGQTGYFQSSVNIWYTADVDTEALSVTTFSLKSADGDVRVNGTEIVSGQPYTESAMGDGGITDLGARYNGSSHGGFLDGNLYQAILRNTTSTTAEIDRAEAYINRKMGGGLL